LALTMPFADCPPVVLYDPLNAVIALLHCGWRPLTHNIIDATLGKMATELNCVPSLMLAAIGPGVCKDCYPVGHDVAKRLGHDVTEFGTIYLSLRDEIRKRLLAAGLAPHNIIENRACTSCASDGRRYFSYRRQRKTDPLDTQMAVVVMR
jgi:copper oxidase (laccase) domain-containing protein